MLFPIIFLLVFGVSLFFQVLSNLQNDKEWHEGLFQSEEDYGEIPRNPLLEAYISLGALMVRNDTSAYSEKILYLNNYFAKNFPNSHYKFGTSFTNALKNPVHPKVISKWLRRKLPHRAQRMQVMYFLASISTVDGSMNKKEIELLREMNDLLQLTPKDLESIIAMYTQRQERENPSSFQKPRYTKVQLACKVLGVSEHASIDEIKKAYRSLVKLHHPDRFATESKEQQSIAEQRFIEIQKAYEILEQR